MTNWLALWKSNTNNSYWSYTLKKKDIPSRCNLIVTKNKYHKEGDNRPPFVFKFGKYDEEYAIEYADLHEAQDIEVIPLEDAIAILEECCECIYDEYGNYVHDICYGYCQKMQDVARQGVEHESR